MDEPAKTESSAAPIPAEPPRPADLSGRVLDDFELIRRLGQGGMGQVYLARQISLKRQVAVKILRAELAANDKSLQRFRQEAEAVARINHANIVQIYSIGEASGLHYMALEYVEGRNLRDYLNRKGPPELPVALNIMRQVAAGLQRAHELGFVHRDIKPENILLTRKGEVKVADFGLSRCFAGEAAPLNITQSGVTMGTPLYMSPEQVKGKEVGPRSDIYSFGVTCYHMLRGEPPFSGGNAFEVALQHVTAEPPPLHEIRPDLPADLCQMVARMMAKQPEERYQSVREIQRDLARLREGMPVAASAIPILSGTQNALVLPRADSAPVTPTSGTLPLPVRRSKMLRWALAGLGLLVAAGVGAAVHWWQHPTQPTAAAVEREPNEEPMARSAEREKTALKKIDDHDVKVEAATDAVLDLLMLYVSEKRFDAAMQLLQSLPKRGAFQDPTGKGMKGAEPWYRFYTQIVAELGRGIVLAYEDKANDSNKHFLAAFEERSLPVKKKEIALVPIDPFLNRHPKWRKEVADALHRNAINLHGKPLPPLLDRYQSYVPKTAPSVEKKQ
jgi:eukaryotic-like serine/threonine-protein kinase